MGLQLNFELFSDFFSFFRQILSSENSKNFIDWQCTQVYLSKNILVMVENNIVGVNPFAHLKDGVIDFVAGTAGSIFLD